MGKIGVFSHRAGGGNVNCRIGCGACCIALSISSPIPGMPDGKPAGVRCVHLSPDNRCLIYDKPDKPVVCSNLRPLEEMCGQTSEEALAYLEFLEQCTSPCPPSQRGIKGAEKLPSPLVERVRVRSFRVNAKRMWVGAIHELPLQVVI
ncbi:MAG: YkgJ family cysteine cluster protein [Planctomycetes bacterium]|nr:YkgJ family cysteine cluster protein [Planctomycetota bacterium]